MKTNMRWAGPALVLIAVNCIPLIGVAFWGWTLFEIVVLYWFENVVIGAINVLKMLTCSPAEEHSIAAAKRGQVASGRQSSASSKRRAAGAQAQPGPDASVTHHASKLFLVPFFTIHYGMFCLVHGIFVFMLLGDGGMLGPGGPPAMLQDMLSTVLGGGLLLAATALIISHTYSYVFHFLWRGELRRTNVGMLFIAPYGRVVVLHVAILFGAFAAVILGQPTILVVLLVIGKTLLDWLMHLNEHLKTAGDRPTSDTQVSPERG